MTVGSPRDLFDRIEQATSFVKERAGRAMDVGLILGSGLGGVAERLADAVVIPYQDIPGFPSTGVVGHAGRLVVGSSGGVTVAAMQGRVHAYEGYEPWQVGFPARVLCRSGIRALVLTNASGGIRPEFRAGDLMRIKDHIDLSGTNPLMGFNDERLGPRFPDMTRAYHPTLAARLHEVAGRLGIVLKTGVYASVRGPSFETPAEIRMLRTLGADAVGMSTVPEVVIAAHMGLPLAAIACISNPAAMEGGPPLTHEEVGETAGKVEARLSSLLEAFFPEAIRPL